MNEPCDVRVSGEELRSFPSSQRESVRMGDQAGSAYPLYSRPDASVDMQTEGESDSPVQRTLKPLRQTHRVICKPKGKATCRDKIAKACREPSLVSLAPNPRDNPVLSQAYPAPSPEMNRARLVSNLDNSLAYHLKPRSSPARYPVKFNRAPGRKDQHVCAGNRENKERSEMGKKKPAEDS